MTESTHYFYEEYVTNAYITRDESMPGWIACGYGYKWTLDQCREKVMERKIVSPRSKLRVVKETRVTWNWRERTKVK